MEPLKMPARSSSVTWEYDREADVLYLSFGDSRPVVGVDIGDGLVLRYDEARQELAGLTVIGLRTRLIQGLNGPD